MTPALPAKDSATAMLGAILAKAELISARFLIARGFVGVVGKWARGVDGGSWRYAVLGL